MKGKNYLFLLFFIVTFTPPHYATAKMKPVNIGPLLTTKWRQGGPYATFTPHNRRLGCWSVALAQILAYHKLQPSGLVQYKGKDYKINEDLSSHKFNWMHFTNSLTSPPKSTEVPRYCYYTAITIGTDFNNGNGGYMGNSDMRRKGIEKHFHCTTVRHAKGTTEADKRKRQQAIITDLTQNRPLLLYVEGDAGDGHALVIDGVRNINGKFEVHLNFGWNSDPDGWYELEKPIVASGHNYYKPTRWVCSIKPK